MVYYVYILRSIKDGRHYIGSTSDIVARLAFHNDGRQRSTKSHIPFELIYTEQFPTREAALAREKQIKSYKGGEAFKKLIAGR